jgi:hypothetical protein
MVRPRTNNVVLYVNLPRSLLATIKQLRQRMGVKFLSDVLTAAIKRALAEIGQGPLLVPVTGEKAVGSTFRIDPELMRCLDQAAADSGIERHNIVRAGLLLLAREHELVDPGKPGGGDRA